MKKSEIYLESKMWDASPSDEKPKRVVFIERAKIYGKIVGLETEIELSYKYIETCEIGTYSFNITNSRIKEKESEIETLMNL